MWIGITVITCVGVIATKSSDWAALVLIALVLDHIFE